MRTPDGRLVVHPKDIEHGLAPGTWEREHGLAPGSWLEPKRRKHKPSLIKAIQAARKAGVDRGTVTVGEVSVTFGESELIASDNSWPLSDFTKVTKQ